MHSIDGHGSGRSSITENLNNQSLSVASAGTGTAWSMPSASMVTSATRMLPTSRSRTNTEQVVDVGVASPWSTLLTTGATNSEKALGVALDGDGAPESSTTGTAVWEMLVSWPGARSDDITVGKDSTTVGNVRNTSIMGRGALLTWMALAAPNVE